MSDSRIDEILARIARESKSYGRSNFTPDLLPTVPVRGPVGDIEIRRARVVPIYSVRYTRSDRTNGNRPIPEPRLSPRDYRGGYVGTGR